MPLYAVLARENFPLRMMGTVIGGTAMAGSLGMATGPLAGGLIYDTFASYAWLYHRLLGMGLGAFLMAMTFRPFPKPKRRGCRRRRECWPPRRSAKHDPEKCEAVFRKDHAQTTT